MSEKKYEFTEKELAEAVGKAWKEGRLTFALDAGAHKWAKEIIASASEAEREEKGYLEEKAGAWRSSRDVCGNAISGVLISVKADIAAIFDRAIESHTHENAFQCCDDHAVYTLKNLKKEVCG